MDSHLPKADISSWEPNDASPAAARDPPPHAHPCPGCRQVLMVEPLVFALKLETLASQAGVC